MRIFLSFLLFSISATALASLTHPSDIATVVSIDGKYDSRYSNAIRDRFIVRRALGSEAGQTIIIEKYSPGRSGSDDKIIATHEFAVSDLPVIKEHLAEISKKSVEATYGCCNVDGIKRVGPVWLFTAKGLSKDFHCKSEESAKNEISISCFK
jgi:hypothetical protein